MSWFTSEKDIVKEAKQIIIERFAKQPQYQKCKLHSKNKIMICKNKSQNQLKCSECIHSHHQCLPNAHENIKTINQRFLKKYLHVEQQVSAYIKNYENDKMQQLVKACMKHVRHLQHVVRIHRQQMRKKLAPFLRQMKQKEKIFSLQKMNETHVSMIDIFLGIEQRTIKELNVFVNAILQQIKQILKVELKDTKIHQLFEQKTLELMNVIGEKDEQIRNLKNELYQQRLLADQLEKRQQITQDTSVKERLQAQLAQLNKQLEKARRPNSREAELQEKGRQLTKMKDQLQLRAFQISKYKKINSELEIKVKELETKLSKGVVAKQNDQEVNLEKEIKELRLKMQNKDEQIKQDRLKNQSIVTELQCRGKQLQRQRSIQQQKCKQLELRIKQMSDQYKMDKQEWQRIVENMQKKMNAVDKENVQKQRELEELLLKQQQMQQKLADQQKQYEIELVVKLTNQLKQMTEQVEQFTVTISGHEAQKAQLINAYEVRIGNMQSQIDWLLRQMERFESRDVLLQQQVTNIKKVKNVQIMELQQSLQKRIEQVEELRVKAKVEKHQMIGLMDGTQKKIQIQTINAKKTDKQLQDSKKQHKKQQLKQVRLLKESYLQKVDLLLKQIELQRQNEKLRKSQSILLSWYKYQMDKTRLSELQKYENEANLQVKYCINLSYQPKIPTQLQQFDIFNFI